MTVYTPPQLNHEMRCRSQHGYRIVRQIRNRFIGVGKRNGLSIVAMARVVTMARLVMSWGLHGLALCEINTLPHEALSRAVGVLLAHETIYQRSTQCGGSDLGAFRSKPGAGVVTRLHGSLGSSREGSASTSLDQRVLPPSRARLGACRH